MGPRRAGKTVMIFHAIQRLLEEKKAEARDIIYLSIDSPNYTGLGLERLVELAIGDKLNRGLSGVFVFFDEIQYLKDWEAHLKTLVDSYPTVKFIASGSAAAALKLKSNESGAGRFTEFLLPPLLFYEFLFLQKKMMVLWRNYKIEALNRDFINYLNYGGFPEAIFSQKIQENPSRFIQSDIIDKVLLRDLPSLYGITDVQELYRLFTYLAFNTAQIVSMDGLSQNTGVKKPTLKRYIEFLEAAFLIKRLYRIDQAGKRYKREANFKVYLTNPSMYAAMFGSVDEKSEAIGALVETAVHSQLILWDKELCYANWKDREVDFVILHNGKPHDCIEVKWSDRPVGNHGEIKGALEFSGELGLSPIVSTYSVESETVSNGRIIIKFYPTSFLSAAFGQLCLEDKHAKKGLRLQDLIMSQFVKDTLT
ncbi:MAG: ATP-binding protein [Nitrospinae bacterium]|nr:ATP-binding protein [Nitrospinota bacterium]